MTKQREIISNSSQVDKIASKNTKTPKTRPKLMPWAVGFSVAALVGTGGFVAGMQVGKNKTKSNGMAQTGSTKTMPPGGGKVPPPSEGENKDSTTKQRHNGRSNTANQSSSNQADNATSINQANQTGN